jgi:hypothetical protein
MFASEKGPQGGRPPLNMVVDRSRTQAAIAIGAAWVSFMIGLLAGGEVDDFASFVVAGVSGAALIVLGFAAAWRCRPMPERASVQRMQLLLLALAAGATLGVANLAANRAIAEAHPTLRALLANRVAGLEAMTGLVTAPIVEEVAIRLCLLSVMAWIGLRLTKRPLTGFALALVGSSLFFAVLHLDRPLPADPALANSYRAALVTKYTLAGLPLGWVFWRWGLPYAILCHVAANAAHLALQGRVF